MLSSHQPLATDVQNVWKIRNCIENGVSFIVLSILFILNIVFEWQKWIGWLLLVLLILTVVTFILGLIVPKFKYKNWHYNVNEEFLIIRQGVWKRIEEWTPMTKVQSVSIEQGPILRKYQLFSIEVKTMGSIHVIPGVVEEEAKACHYQIATYAKIKEVENE